jgi:hypothetical protein
MKLVPELVPEPLWGHSAYRLLGRSSWKAIRKDVLNAAKNSCQPCGITPSPLDSDPLTCHEQWHYDDKKRVATLIGFEIHCSACDSATHMGRAVQHGAGDRALNQLRKVNGISISAAQDLFVSAMILWKARSKKKWSVRVDPKLIETYPKLAILETSSKGKTPRRR